MRIAGGLNIMIQGWKIFHSITQDKWVWLRMAAMEMNLKLKTRLLSLRLKGLCHRDFADFWPKLP